MSQPLGSLLDALGVVHEPEEGELIAGAYVLLRVITAGGSEYVRYAQSEGMSWVEKVGLLRIAEHACLDDVTQADDEGEQ